jgi:2'-5' RNA ligase
VRVFVGLAVPDDVTRRLDDAVRDLRERDDRCNWPPPATWHVTLAFVGEIADDRAGDVTAATERAVRRTGTGAIALTLAAPGRFGQRVGWLGVADRPDGAVAELGEAVQTEVAEEGLPVDRKPVRPHLTLVRARGKGRLPAALLEALPELGISWEVDEATVYRSDLGPGPLRYEVLATVLLGG